MIADKHFIDWESNTFGYGYGTGEQYTIPALKKFMNCCKNGRSYEYGDLEKELGGTVAWLMINIFCHQDLIDYGSSPRFGWLNEKGQLLKEFVDSKTEDELYSLTCQNEEYEHCYPHVCNCDFKKCENPLFKK